MSREEYDKIKNTLQLTMSGLLTSTTKKMVYKPHVIPAWASHTCSYARINLFSYFKYNPMYCDTDSIFTKKTMPTSTKIGGMKLEYDVRNAILVKPKMYMYDVIGKGYKVRMKGVSGVTKEKFLDVMQGKKVSFDKFTKLKEAVRRGMIPNSVNTVDKFLKLEDTKRIWREKFNPNELQDSEALSIT